MYLDRETEQMEHLHYEFEWLENDDIGYPVFQESVLLCLCLFEQSLHLLNLNHIRFAGTADTKQTCMSY